jgi:quercetin dioxygenase-like cupin family protein
MQAIEKSQSKQKPIVKEVNVIARNDIQVIHSVKVDGKIHTLGEHRDFRRHSLLENFLPDFARFSLSWVHLNENQELEPHQHQVPSMIIVCKGTGLLTGQKNQPLQEGDIVIVPPNSAHGFIGKGLDGFHGLSVQFGHEGGLYENINSPLVNFIEPQHKEFTFEKFLAHNQKKLEQIKKSRFFTMLEDGTLNDPKKRTAYLDNLEIWTIRNQLLLFTRQSTCADKKFEKTFLQHFNEEIGHDDLYNERANKGNLEDPVIEAIASWFVHQMFVRDNIEKAAIIFLVIENTSHYYHTLAKSLLIEHVNEGYLKAHEEDDAHVKMGLNLLKGESPLTYQRLIPVIDKAWEMLTAMVERVAQLTEKA